MMNGKQKLTRPRNGRMLSGVCAGLADFFGLDVSLVRIIMFSQQSLLHLQAYSYTSYY